MTAVARPVPLVEHAMEVHAHLRRFRKDTAPLYLAALATGNFTVMSETHALAESLRIAQLQAKRLAGFAEIACADNIAKPGHGTAA